jgi:thioredoxin 1
VEKLTTMLTVTEENYDRVVAQNPQPVVLSFTASWSGSSSIMHAIVADMAERFAGRVTIARIDADGSTRIAERLGVSSIPTVLIFSEGEVVDMIEGMLSGNELAQKVSAVLRTNGGQR